MLEFLGRVDNENELALLRFFSKKSLDQWLVEVDFTMTSTRQEAGDISSVNRIATNGTCSGRATHGTTMKDKC
jgi:hypothetical protein